MKPVKLITAGTISAAILSIFLFQVYVSLNELTSTVEEKTTQLQTLEANLEEVNSILDVFESDIAEITPLNDKISKVITDAWKPVVTVVTRSTDPAIRSGGHGTGFIVDIEKFDAYIVTNHHVIEAALTDPNMELVVYTANHPWEYEVEVVGHDKYADIAVLKITKQEQEVWTKAEWADHTETSTGDWIVSIGHGFGLRFTISQGMITYTNRFGIQPLQSMIQHDAAINPGNSGGPIFNLEGKVVGVNDMILSKSAQEGGGWDGISLAIAGWHAELSYNTIREKGEMRYPEIDFGVRVAELSEVTGISEDDRQYYYLYEIEEGEYGYDVGLRNGDSLIAINDMDIDSYIKFFHTLINQEPNTVVTITVERDGNLIMYDYTLSEIEE